MSSSQPASPSPSPESGDWAFKIEEVDGELSWEVTGNPPDFFTLYGIVNHIASHGLQKALDDAEGS